MNLLDFPDLEDVLELEEDVVSLCFVSKSANVALSRASVASYKNFFLFKLERFF